MDKKAFYDTLQPIVTQQNADIEVVEAVHLERYNNPLVLMKFSLSVVEAVHLERYNNNFRIFLIILKL